MLEAYWPRPYINFMPEDSGSTQRVNKRNISRKISSVDACSEFNIQNKTLLLLSCGSKNNSAFFGKKILLKKQCQLRKNDV